MEFTNKLAVLLLTTQSEYQSGLVDECIKKFFLKDASLNLAVDIYIYFNKGELNDYSGLNKYSLYNSINQIFVNSLHLSDSEDWYCRSPEDFKKLKSRWDLKLGGSSGPNNLFYRSFDDLFGADYRDILLIETDCSPIKKNWLDKIIEYCDNNKFLISGSIYKGKAKVPPFQVWTGHLNGVAIYRNSSFLKTFIQKSRELIEYDVKNKINNFTSFDVAMHKVYSTLFGRKNCHSSTHPEKQLVNCEIISNFSLPEDKNTPLDSVIKQYPETIILHKK